MGSHSNTETELRTLERKWEQITDIPDTPRSVMDVIEYSLDSQRKAEVYVNRLLAYFLDPEESHGIGTEFLRAVLDGLPEGCEFQEDIHDLSDIVVDDQVRVTEEEDGEAKSTGIVDLVIEVPNEWFLMVELKFSAEDTQTEFYYQDVTHLGGNSKSEYESGEYYVYFHQHDRPEAKEPGFTNWTWGEFSADVLEPFVLEHASRFPHRTIAQLHEFNDDITNIAGMSDQAANEQEKVALYLEHYDAITDVTKVFDERWEDFTDEWGRRLGDSLEQAGVGSSTTHEEPFVEFDLNDGGGWWFRTSDTDWAMIFKRRWWRHLDDLQNAQQMCPDDNEDVRIGFHHRLEKHRDTAVGERTLKFFFRCMGANDQEFIDDFVDRFDERSSEIAGYLPANAELTGNRRDLVEAEYDIQAPSSEEFFDAYVAALNRAFSDFVVGNEELIEMCDQMFMASIEEVYGESIEM